MALNPQSQAQVKVISLPGPRGQCLPVGRGQEAWLQRLHIIRSGRAAESYVRATNRLLAERAHDASALGALEELA